MEMLHLYVELVVVAAAAASEQNPATVAHLHACGPCPEDFQGLLAAITDPPS